MVDQTRTYLVKILYSNGLEKTYIDEKSGYKLIDNIENGANYIEVSDNTNDIKVLISVKDIASISVEEIDVIVASEELF